MHKKNLVKYFKTKKFSVSIDRALIKQAEARLEKSRNFQLIENHTQWIEILENWIFWKIAEDYAETTQTKEFHEWNA